MIRIVHISDWHGEAPPGSLPLPAADMYVMTGDMLPNFPIMQVRSASKGRYVVVEWKPNSHLVLGGDDDPFPQGGEIVGRHIYREREVDFQTAWAQRFMKDFRSCLESPESPIVIVRGNHDFVDVGRYIGGDVFEIVDDPFQERVICGLRVGGARGVPYLEGEWNDELQEHQLSARMERLSLWLDLVVTHIPPAGILDDYCGRSLGSAGLARYANKRAYDDDPKALSFLFGHVHNKHGVERKGKMVFSNAATSVNVLEV